MKSHVLLTLSASLTQVLAAPYIERPTRDLTGHETVTTTASAEYRVDGLPGLPKPQTMFLTSSTHSHHTHGTHHAHGTETGAVIVPVPTPGGYGGIGSFTEHAIAESDSETESIVTEVETETVDIKTVTVDVAASADASHATNTNSIVAGPKHKTAITVHPVFVTASSAKHTSNSNVAHPRNFEVQLAGPEKQEFTTLTFTFGTMATTYTLALPNGADATDTPAPVIRPTRSYPLAPPSGTWTEWNSMITSTIPAGVIHRSAATSPFFTLSGTASGYHKILPIPAPNPNPLEEAALSMTTPTPTLPRPREQVLTTILNGGAGAVERLEDFQVGKEAHSMDANHSDAPVSLPVNKHHMDKNDAPIHVRDDAPESHDLSWYFTASYTDDSVSLTMQPCYYDWQCWPEPTSSNTEVFLPGVDGGNKAKVAAATKTATQTASQTRGV